MPSTPASAPSETAPTLDERVRHEVVRITLDRTRVSNLISLPGAALVAWVLWPHVEQRLLLAWLGGKAVTCGARWWMDRRAAADAPSALPQWGNHYAAALAADGLLFGMLGWLLLPPDIASIDAVMAATLVGIAAIGLVVLSASWRACMAFTLPLMLPGTIHQLMQGDRISLYLGMGMLLFVLLLVAEVRKAAAHTRQMLRLGFQSEDLARERQAALEHALRSDAAKSQFLATMSHEMRTPLHGILGLARELQQPGLAEGLRSARLQTLERTGDHLLGIINDVLDYSKIESGHLRLAPHDFELGALLSSLHSLCSGSAAERGLALRLEHSLPLPCWVHGDAVRLRQILLNLLGNAIKFTDSGSVTLAVQCIGATADPLPLVIEVRDTGPGVPIAERERIFDAFHQADGSSTRRKGGTGLGLTVSRELAIAMGGDLRCVDSGAPGAVFRLTLALPRAPSPAAQAMPAAAGPARVAARVLLVEDNEVNAIVAGAILERAGATVTHVHDGESAVEQALSRAHDLILMDCQMPGVDGFEATTRIRAHERAAALPRVAIIALTANALEGDRQRCLDAGMDDHLSKPFREQDLLQVVQRHLGPA